MEWNLRMTAAQRGIWRASDLRRLLAEAGLQMSVGKMSNLWSGRPISVRLDDLDVICAVLDCSPSDLLLRSPAVAKEAPATEVATTAGSVRPRAPRGSRALPPV
jgi:putative transcriptional regulator